MKKIGFVGLGIMGGSMATNLLAAGYELAVFNRSPGKSEALAALGARVCPTPAGTAAGADAVVVMVRADQDVEEVVLGPAGIAQGASPGLVILNCSTILPSTSRRLAAELEGRGIDILDCPVTGSAPQAREAKLTFMAGGSEAAFRRCTALFQAMGKAAYYLGPSGSGSSLKLANNTMYAINLLSFLEALTIVARSGIDPEKFLEIVGQGGARSIVAEHKLPKILGRDFSPAFSLAMMNKDLGLVGQLAGELGVGMPMLAAATGVYGDGLRRGWGDEDLCAAIKVYEAAAGQAIRK